MKLKKKTNNGKVDADSPFYELIQEAYRVFKQSPTEHGVCECCMYPEIRKDFFNHGQADIPLSYINDWFFAAADIPLNKDKWRFVLPRILEVLASGEEPSSSIGIEVSLSRFATGDKKNWSEQEWAILDKFQRLFFTHFETVYDDCLDDIVCMFSIGGWSTESLFDQLYKLPIEKLVNYLWRDWCSYPNPNIWITPFWDNESIPWQFYTSDKLLDKITEYALNSKTPPELSEKAMAVSDLINSKLSV